LPFGLFKSVDDGVSASEEFDLSVACTAARAFGSKVDGASVPGMGLVRESFSAAAFSCPFPLELNKTRAMQSLRPECWQR